MIDDRTFRSALSTFPTGVVIITGTTEQGQHLGMTVSSFNSVSLNPPLVLFSLSRNSRSLAAWRLLQHYAINVLSEEQEHLSTQFAGTLENKWSGVNILKSHIGLPVFPSALATFECEAYARYDGGDHADLYWTSAGIAQNSKCGATPRLFWRAV